MKQEKKQISKKGFRIKWSVITALCLVAVVVVNFVLFMPMKTILTNFFQPKTERTEALKKAAADLCEDIEDEGIVLLKNEDNTLPMTEEKPKINVFGWSSTNPVYGGTGSGSVDTATATDLLGGLDAAGIEYNTQLTDFYKGWRDSRPTVGMGGQDWTVPEPTMEEYDKAEVFEKAKDFSDTAVVVIARSGGEGADLPLSITDENTLKEGGIFGMEGVRYTEYEDEVDPDRHYLELSPREQVMLDRVTKEFEDVVVVLNMNNAMELNWVDEYDIDSVVWVGGPGESGFKALGSVLTGNVNPSGRTVDTYVKDLTKDPAYANFGNFEYTGSDGYHFVNYAESIYMGYRFYETYFMNNEAGYEEAVQYPFGYGLSYTEFEQKMGEIQEADGKLTVDVEVKNTGNTAGKEVVQLYSTAPYTEGGIEKSYVALAAFGKTNLLEPGESGTVTLELQQEDLASYDDQTEKAYVLDAGDYELKLMKNAHEIIDSKIYTVNENIVYGEDEKRSTDQEVATNRFDFARGDVTYLSRANGFANYEEALAKTTDKAMTKEEEKSVVYELPTDEGAQEPTVGASGNLKVEDMAGLDYDDEKWDLLLDQMSLSDMDKLIVLGGYSTQRISSIGKDATIDIDGPQGLSSFMGSSLKGGAYPTEVVIASTYNTELAYKRGEMMGNESLELGVSGWYGPAMNTHRLAFAGRNFEYYSEDGLLAGKIGAQETAGAASRGLYAYIKHFALNDQETNRCDKVLTWSTEQAMREIYLKPFELCVKEGNATAVMSSFNFIGPVWGGGCSQLLQEVLRGEWGFRGMVITDYFGYYGYMDANQAIATGNDLMLATFPEEGTSLKPSQTATGHQNMRRASHNILYTIANSNAVYSQEQKQELLKDVGGTPKRIGMITKAATNMNMQPWMLITIFADILIGILLIVMVIRKLKKYKNLS